VNLSLASSLFSKLGWDLNRRQTTTFVLSHWRFYGANQKMQSLIEHLAFVRQQGTPKQHHLINP